MRGEGGSGGGKIETGGKPSDVVVPRGRINVVGFKLFQYSAGV